MRYIPPSPADLRRLKNELELTSEQMAELFGLAGGQQWRKYTGGIAPREMGPQMLFLAAARLVLDEQELGRVLDRMREVGADVQLAAEAIKSRPPRRETAAPAPPPRGTQATALDPSSH